MLRFVMRRDLIVARAHTRVSGWATGGALADASGHDGDADALLVGAARHGDDEAFDMLVARHAARLHAVARRLVGAHAAEDVVQEALWAAYQGLHRFRGEARFATYLHTIVVRHCQKAMRRRPPWAPLLDDRLASDVPGPGEEAERAALGRALHAALARLPRREREVLVLRETAGLRYDEIAAALRVPIGTVRSRIARGRERMRSWLLAQGVRP